MNNEGLTSKSFEMNLNSSPPRETILFAEIEEQLQKNPTNQYLGEQQEYMKPKQHLEQNPHIRQLTENLQENLQLRESTGSQQYPEQNLREKQLIKNSQVQLQPQELLSQQLQALSQLQEFAQLLPQHRPEIQRQQNWQPDQDQFTEQQHLQSIQIHQKSLQEQITETTKYLRENYIINKEGFYNISRNYINEDNILEKFQELKDQYKALENENNELKIKLENKSKNWQFWGTSGIDKDQHQKIVQELQSEKTLLKSEYRKLQEESAKELESKNNHIHQLKEVNVALKNETTKYQLALGEATSFHLENRDSNSPGKLSNDILVLHKSLEKFCNLKRGIEVKEQGVQELSKKFKCPIIDDIRSNKNRISGLLERLVIETIIEKTKEYFDLREYDKSDEQQQDLEVKIYKTAEQLLKLTDSISTTRTGSDEISKATSTKLRQQIYGVLGNRGFSCIRENDKEPHPFIAKLQKEIVGLMNNYRAFKDEKKKLENEAMIHDVIRQIINIFFFRLKVQEPIAEYKFFEHKSSVNTIMMDASLDSSDLEEIYVDICAFPVIGSNLCEADEENENLKVIFQAQIIPNKTVLDT